ncbi:MAG: inorganic phosphate transporter, partial [Bacteroidales bacterium]
METIYLFFVIALLVLAMADLIVGVGNDAVNFLNSAIGARVAPFYFILSVAALGVLIGATFSSGMMEIARSGIFHPDQFYFSEIMVIFLAVMITDMILLDVFNTFGMPTSTTVSIIFEILGAAVAVSLFKIMGSTDSLSDIGNYINSGRALAIISGILLSVVVAFSVGAFVQFLTRILFTF